MAAKLGKNQLIALKYAATRGEHDPRGAGNRPWQLSDSQYRRVLDSLVVRGLVRRDDERGYVWTTLNFKQMGKSRGVFVPLYEITAEGLRALADI